MKYLRRHAGRMLIGLALGVLWLLHRPALAEQSIDSSADAPLVLLIGVADYGTWGGLKGPAFDTCALYSLYRNLLLVPASNIVVHMNVAPGVPPPCQIPDAKPVSAESVQASMVLIGNRRSPASALYLHYSGHGFEADDGPQLVLSVADVGRQAETVSLAVLLRSLRSLPTPPAKVAIFLDACRDTAMASALKERSAAQGKSATEIMSLALQGLVGAVYLAASPGEYSYTRRSIQGSRSSQLMGYFTWAVIRGMLGGARTGGGEITFQSLAEYLEREVPLSRQFELLGAVREPQQPKAIMLSSGSPHSRLDPPRSVRLNESFLFYAEASVEPQDETGRSLAGPFSLNVMTPQSGRPSTELNLIGATVVQPPGPFKVPLPIGMEVPASVHRWAFAVRTVFFWGPNRREFVVCNASPRIPEAGAVAPEIIAGVDAGALVIDIREAWRRIGHWIAQADDLYDPAVAAQHFRKVAQGC